MNVLFVASECAPFVKTGGLADVVAALPKALGEHGVSVRIALPAYRSLDALVASGREVARFDYHRLGEVRVVATQAEGLSLLLIVAPDLFDRAGGPYLDAAGRDFLDNHVRFATLCHVAARLAREGVDGFDADIVHAHDWQAGLVATYLHEDGGRRVGTVTTIHNIAFQGVFPARTLDELGLPADGYTVEGFEYYGHISFLKAGLNYADRITTVSPTYARELMSPTFGMGFEGILAARRERFSGILNGVDVSVWNPASDAALPAPYAEPDPALRSANKAALVARFELEIAPDAPLFCVVSRITGQKGIDLLVDALPAILSRGAGLVVLGSGASALENELRSAAAANPKQIGVEIGYDETLSHLMQGGADAIIVPSRFEPCGLTQLYGLRYGCLPLVARTGGLTDTVIDANDAALTAGVATGFQFSPIDATTLADAIDRACEAYANQGLWRQMMARAMAHPVGWDRSAAAYRAVYDDVATGLARPGSVPVDA